MSQYNKTLYCVIFSATRLFRLRLGHEKEDGIGGGAARNADEEIDCHAEENTSNEEE